MIPTKEDWEEAWKGLDEAYAFDHFYNKTLKEAEDMIEDKPTYYCEDFSYMPKVPFRFYFQSFESYLTSSRSEHDFDAADSFVSLIEHFLDYDYDWIEDFWPSIVNILNRLADRPDFYGSTKIYKFPKRVNRIIQKQVKLNR